MKFTAVKILKTECHDGQRIGDTIRLERKAIYIPFGSTKIVTDTYLITGEEGLYWTLSPRPIIAHQSFERSAPMPPQLPRLPISDQVWRDKYRFSGGGFGPVPMPPDQDITDSWHRVARALASVETSPGVWEPRFYQALEGFKFLPAGRILAGAGTGRAVTLHNCFVMDTIQDSMQDIFRNLGEAAITMQAGGGIGYDFSTLRPKGSPVVGVGADASGPLSFMECWDSMCKTVMSAGSRRGAMMATLRCDHPDIEGFITAKRTPGRLTNFNLSVLITDDFMAAVESGDDWDLVFGGKVFKTIRARDLWQLIMKTTYDVAEPGVIFIDQINQRNNLYYAESIAATNPCGEQPLPPYGTCLLGSINLAAFIREPFSASARLDTELFLETIATAVRMMDNVVEASLYPVPRQQDEARAKRRIGLGVTGLADALAMSGVRYGSPEAVKLTKTWMADFRYAAYLASVQLAKEKGPFPLFDSDKYCAGKTVIGLPANLWKEIKQHGIRNALVTSIAPTGTISLYADNVSSGIEPIFALEYTRKTLQPDGTRREETVTDYAVRMWHQLRLGEPLPAQFVTAQDLEVEDHLVMQAAVQGYVDSSISKTINVPEQYPFDRFQEIYRQAYQTGCKGCTTYRPSAERGSVLEVASAKPTVPAPAPSVPGPVTFKRPDDLPGVTSRLKWQDDPSYFLALNTFEGKPFEVFINSMSTVHSQWTTAVSRLITEIFRRGGDISFVPDVLIQITDPNGGSWIKGKTGSIFVKSLVALIGFKLRDHLIRLGHYAATEAPAAPEPEAHEVSAPVVHLQEPKGEICPKCSSPTVFRKESCATCTSCGYSSCG